jgi:hypothetical protein
VIFLDTKADPVSYKYIIKGLCAISSALKSLIKNTGVGWGGGHSMQELQLTAHENENLARCEYGTLQG